MTVKIRVLSTGETGTVIGSEAGGQYLIELADGGTRAVSGTEQVQVIPPGWSVSPGQGTS